MICTIILNHFTSLEQSGQPDGCKIDEEKSLNHLNLFVTALPENEQEYVKVHVLD